MTEEITKLDDKYLVLKWSDINSALDAPMQKLHFINLVEEIQHHRKVNNKKNNNYVVLNLDDEISIDYLIERFKRFYIDCGECEGQYNDVRIKRIAVDLVNAVLKAKEKR